LPSLGGGEHDGGGDEGSVVSTIETGTEDLLARVDDGVAVVTMNRPERRNALSGAMLDAMARVLADLEIDSGVGCVVLTGAGGAFCAGGDVKGMAEASADGGRLSFDERIHRQRLQQRATSGKLWSMPKPTIAWMPGAAAGAGLSLALACDLRYMAQSAVVTTAFAKVGFAGDYGGIWFLSRLIGSAKARELYFLSDRVDSAEAERLGIVNGVFPDDELEGEVMSRARRIAEGPRIAYRYMKENFNRSMNGDVFECMDMEAAHHNRTGQTEDHREAALAFTEKRPPVFHGR
jgi:2-(1,2-epoxy-1,2-dihydrophenyl)acetyl-CoA isomerase